MWLSQPTSKAQPKLDVSFKVCRHDWLKFEMGASEDGLLRAACCVKTPEYAMTWHCFGDADRTFR